MPPKRRGTQKRKAATKSEEKGVTAPKVALVEPLKVKAATKEEKKTPAKCDGPTKTSTKLPLSFYDKDCVDLAKALLGKRLVREIPEGRVSGIIVETEAYLGGDDKAAHSHKGKNNKNAAMFMPPGTGYVYHIYGLYTCMNVSSRGDGAAVLLRGLDPSEGEDIMRKFRGAKRSDKGAGMKVKDFGNGPSKLTQALSIGKKDLDQQDLTTLSHTWLEEGVDVDPADIIACARIGVDYAGDWAKKPLRFYVKGNKGVSVKDKMAEAETATSVGGSGK